MMTKESGTKRTLDMDEYTADLIGTESRKKRLKLSLGRRRLATSNSQGSVSSTVSSASWSENEKLSLGSLTANLLESAPATHTDTSPSSCSDAEMSSHRKRPFNDGDDGTSDAPRQKIRKLADNKEQCYINSL